MDPVAKVIIYASKDKPDKVDGRDIHLLPCHIAYTGPAEVNRYFQREKLDGVDDLEMATFRGRLLYGSTLPMPNDFKMFVGKKRANCGSQQQLIDVEETRQKCMLWEYDRIPNERNPIPRALKFLAIASDLAAPDTDNDTEHSA